MCLLKIEGMDKSVMFFCLIRKDMPYINKQVISCFLRRKDMLLRIVFNNFSVNTKIILINKKKN